MLVQCGTMLCGIIIGEIFHRISLLIEEIYHLKSRHRKSVTKTIQAVFSNKHGQYVKVPLLFFMVPLLVQFFGNVNLFSLEVARRMSGIILVWTVLRMFGAFENSLEDLEILEESNAELGPGLAANYWFSFLKPALMADIRQKMEEYLTSVKNKIMVDCDGTRTRTPGVGSHYRNLSKLIVLLPDDCHLKIRDEKKLEEENIFKCIPELCGGSTQCSHDLEFKLEPGQRRSSIKQTVYWIFESPEYEKEDKTQEEKICASKIFVIFDFPQLIQSAMGPDRGWDEKDRPGARKKNIHSFKKTLRSLLNCNEYVQFSSALLLHTFQNGARSGQGQRKPLSEVLREKILEEETKERVYSSSSCSDTELEP